MTKQDNAEYLPILLVTLQSLKTQIKHITINIKSEALAEAPLEYTHDTRYRDKKSERRITINYPPLELLNHTRALALLTNTPSPNKPPSNKKVKIWRTSCRLL